MCGHIRQRHACIVAGERNGKCGGFVTEKDGGKHACGCTAFITPEDASLLESISLDGILAHSPTEEHTWPTYGGATRNNPFVERKISITLESLSDMMEKLPKFPKMPPYYRAHPETYRSILWQCRVEVEHVESLKFSHVTIVEDPTIPVGAFLPPEGWGKDE